MSKEEIKDLLYNVRNEFENEIDSYTSDYKKDLEDADFNIMFEFLDRFLNKADLLIEDYEE